VNAAYVDTSCLVAIAFGESGGTHAARRLHGVEEIVSSNLLEAELRAAFSREEVPFDAALLSGITWILPDRPLTDEIALVLETGYLRGADVWHIACALFVAGNPRDLGFLTLDDRQAHVAERLGFVVART